MLRQKVEIIVPASVDPGEFLPGIESELRSRIKDLCDDLLGLDSCEPEDIIFEYGEPC